jgi:hypothetical protein
MDSPTIFALRIRLNGVPAGIMPGRIAPVCH